MARLSCAIGIAVCLTVGCQRTRPTDAPHRATEPPRTPGNIVPRQDSDAPDVAVRALQGLQAAVETKMEQLEVPGVALAVVVDGQVVHLAGHGVRRHGTSDPVDPDTLFNAGSTTKAFTALLTMIAVEEHDLDLDGSPRQCLPWFRLGDTTADHEVTIRHMLTHSTGAPRTEMGWYTGTLSRREAVEMAASAPPVAAPGERFSYQNAMYAGVGACAASTLGGSYEDQVRDRILKPLGMERSTVRWSEVQTEGNFAVGTAELPDDRGLQAATMRPFEAMAPAGGLWSSARDMGRWLVYLLDASRGHQPRLVSAEAFDAMWTAQVEVGPNRDYGFGWSLGKWRGRRLVSHYGKINFSTTLVALLPDENVGLVVLSNAPSHRIEKWLLGEVFARVVEGERPKPAPDTDVGPATSSTDPKAKWPPLPQTTPTPQLTASAVLRRMRRARGRKYDELDGLFIRREVEVVPLGLRTVEEEWRSRPDQLDLRIHLRAFGRTIGEQRVVHDGERGAYSKAYDPDFFTSKKMGQRIAIEAIFDPIDPSAYDSVEVLGTLEHADEPVVVLVKQARGGARIVEYVSQRTDLPVRREISVPRDDGGPAMTEVFEFSDVRRVGGIAFPHRVDQMGSDGPVVTSLVTAIAFDPSPPPETFDVGPP